MLHVIIGPSCSGKSTYVDAHAKDGDVVVDFDRIAQALGCRTPHGATGAVKAHAFAARQTVIDGCIERGDEAWVIHSEPTPEQAAAYEACGAEVTTMDTPMDECLRRCEADGRPDGTADRIREWFEKHEKGGAMKRTKDFAVAFKADGDGARIEGYASTWDREPDSYGDVVRKGAFTKAIARLAAEGRKLPLLWGHRLDDPLFNIGQVDELREDETGLWFSAFLDMDNERAAYARKLAKEGRVHQFSFAYDVVDEAPVTLPDGTKANELRELDIYEISLVPIPANRHAVLTDVKSGRVLSAKNVGELERARELCAQLGEAIDGLLKAAGADEPTDGGGEQAKGDAPEEPGRCNAEKARLLEVIDNMK